MNASPRLETLRRPPVLAALALAAAFGAGAWLLADELTSHVRPVSTASIQPAPRALDTARQALDTAIEVAIPTAAAGTGADDVATAIGPAAIDPVAAGPAPAAEDPYAILEPVDPAEVLFGDQTAVRVSND